VVVRVQACGVCRSDLKMAAEGHRALVYPRVPGHEAAGTVAASRSPAFKIGDRVTVAPGLRCGRCPHCRRGADQRCESRDIIGFSLDGGFAEYLAVPLQGEPRGALVPLPECLEFAGAALAEPLACCLNAQSRVSLGAGDRVLVVGAGILGLLHLVLARRSGAASIWVVEPRAGRRDLALALGADLAFDPSALRDLPRSSRDVLIMAAGPVALAGPLAAGLARGGRICLFSGPGPGSAGLPDAAAIHYQELLVSGSYGCAQGHIRRAVGLLAEGRVPIDRLVTGRIRLADLPAYLTAGPGPADLKTVVEI
jgi:L-iditol 2-dehydrogenase